MWRNKISKLSVVIFLALYVTGQLAIADHYLHHDHSELCKVCVSYGQPVANSCHEIVIVIAENSTHYFASPIATPYKRLFSPILQRAPPHQQAV